MKGRSPRANVIFYYKRCIYALLLSKTGNHEESEREFESRSLRVGVCVRVNVSVSLQV